MLNDLVGAQAHVSIFLLVPVPIWIVISSIALIASQNGLDVSFVIRRYVTWNVLTIACTYVQVMDVKE